MLTTYFEATIVFYIHRVPVASGVSHAIENIQKKHADVLRLLVGSGAFFQLL